METSFLSKFLPLLVYPLGATLISLLVIAVLALSGFRRLGGALLICAAGMLWVFSTPLFANWLISSLEDDYPPGWIEIMPRANVAILLGGMASMPATSPTPQFSDAVDRLFYAAQLYHAGNVDYILVSGGNLPWQPASIPEAVVVAAVLVRMGVPQDAIVVESKSQNTHENAVFSKTIVEESGWDSALLVTSGSHMPRALAAFSKAGIDAVPAATDLRAYWPRPQSALDLMPDAGALALTTDAIKEYIGLVVYRMRGWI